MKKLIEIQADALVSTLGGMAPEKADKIVREVAETLYTQVLGKKGKIVKVRDIFACGGKNAHIADFQFVEEKHKQYES